MPEIIGNCRVPRLALPPSSPAPGELYFDTQTNTLYWWSGSSWVAAQGGLSGPPSGPAGGALAGNYPNPQIQTDAIGAAHISAGAVGNSELAPNAVDSSKIADGSVALADLAANSVDASKIVDGSVGAAEIADGSITANEIAANAVGASEIADASIAFAELASGALPSEFGAGTTPSITADTNGRTYEPTKSSYWQKGLALMPSTMRLSFSVVGTYLVFLSGVNWTAANGSQASLFFLRNGSTLYLGCGASGYIIKGASPATNSGLFSCGPYNATAGDALTAFIYCSGGGTCQLNMGAVRLA